MSPTELVETIWAKGGVLTLDGDQIRYRLPEDALVLVEVLRERKADVIAVLQERGGRVAAFPHCPRCSSYALYRRNNVGHYECQTCELQGISEDAARRTQ